MEKGQEKRNTEKGENRFREGPSQNRLEKYPVKPYDGPVHVACVHFSEYPNKMFMYPKNRLIFKYVHILIFSLKKVHVFIMVLYFLLVVMYLKRSSCLHKFFISLGKKICIQKIENYGETIRNEERKKETKIETQENWAWRKTWAHVMVTV